MNLYGLKLKRFFRRDGTPRGDGKSARRATVSAFAEQLRALQISHGSRWSHRQRRLAAKREAIQ